MSLLFNWIYYINKTGQWFLNMTGLSKKKASLLVVGLDNAGKTTLLGMLANDHIQCHTPTSHPNKEIIRVGNIEFSAYDLGGHVAARRLWKSYYASVDCILFMIDTTDIERMEESRDELARLRGDIVNVPIMILGNKIDARGSCSEKQLRDFLVLDYEDNVALFMCSVVKRAGIKEAFKWLSTKI